MFWFAKSDNSHMIYYALAKRVDTIYMKVNWVYTRIFKFEIIFIHEINCVANYQIKNVARQQLLLFEFA